MLMMRVSIVLLFNVILTWGISSNESKFYYMSLNWMTMVIGPFNQKKEVKRKSHGTCVEMFVERLVILTVLAIAHILYM
jgi:hypothetical protein